MMKPVRILLALALAAPLSACITPHQEDAKLRMPWPLKPEEGLLAYRTPADDYPTVGGDTMKGTTELPRLDTGQTTPAKQQP